jgi:hypothetical protein
MIARHTHGAESHVIVDQIENTVEAVTVSHLDAEGSSKQKGKGRRSRKSWMTQTAQQKRYQG